MPQINKPSSYFNTKLYTGNGSTQSISGIGFQPDFTWIKVRSTTGGHRLVDAVRGATKFLVSNATNAEGTDATQVASLDSDGFTVGSDSATNLNSGTFASWNWLASNTTASNTDGSITSTVSANTTSGFSIVSYTGTGTAGTVGHGLNNAPEMIILKRRDGGSGNTNWFVGHKDLTSWGYRIFLNVNLAEAADSDFLANTAPTSNHFSVSTDISTNGSSGSQLAYCFHSVKGFSKFGGYTGNGSTNGPFIYTGFKPAWVMIKRTDSAHNWTIVDSTRSINDGSMEFLLADTSSAEDTDPFYDIVSNGFKLRDTALRVNASGGTYIYMCFAEAPFTTSTGIPTTAR